MLHTDHLKMLCDIGEINQLFTDTSDLNAVSERIVEMVAAHMHTAVCSVYFYDETSEELVLNATTGLDRDMAKQVRLKKGEGLVGRALEELRPICVTEASKNENFKFFPGLKEEAFEAFLAVPICQGVSRAGVLVIQREAKYPFTSKDIAALKVISSQLAAIVAQLRIFNGLGTTDHECIPDILDKLKFLKGKIAAGGYAVGQSTTYRVETSKSLFDKFKPLSFTPEDFEKALKKTEDDLGKLQKTIEKTLADVASLIFSAHLLMLKDSKFTGKMRELIKEGMPVTKAVVSVGEKYLNIFAASPNAVIREKTQDIEDLLRRLLKNLEESSNEEETNQARGSIVIARELFPSDILKLATDNIKGVILISGGVTSHIAILARSLKLPTVIIDNPLLLQVPEETKVIIDAEIGNVYINPDDETTDEFEKQKKLSANILKNRDTLKLPAQTVDGTKISLLANINLLSDLNSANECFAEGIGLYRTEFPFLIRNDFPSEEEQFFVYEKLVEGMKNYPITFRTLDIGGDKLLSYYNLNEQNPFLGFRSIRFSLQHKKVFKQQIRAILRAGYKRNIRIMFPMISSVDEFRAAKAVLDECLQELKKNKIQHNPSPAIGIMVEIPSIIEILADIAAEVDFFSIGTNDLIQFLLAVDRTNEKVASFYNPLHPAVLRTLKRITTTAAEHDVDVCLCGDMAHEGKYIPFLLGIGIRNLSIDPIYIPKIKHTIRALDLKETESLAKKMLEKNTIAAITSEMVGFFNTK